MAPVVWEAGAVGGHVDGQVDRQDTSARHRRCWRTSSWPRPSRQPPRKRRRWKRCRTPWTEITSSSSASSSCWTQRRPSTRWAGPHRESGLTVGTVYPLGAQRSPSPLACSPCVSTGGELGGWGDRRGRRASRPWHQASALPADDPHLLKADWQQAQVPCSAACLESEARRGGEGETPQPSPAPL